MDRASLRAPVLAVSALLVFACANAHANPSAVTPDAAMPAAEQLSPTDPAQMAPAEDADSSEGVANESEARATGWEEVRPEAKAPEETVSPGEGVEVQVSPPPPTGDPPVEPQSDSSAIDPPPSSATLSDPPKELARPIGAPSSTSEQLAVAPSVPARAPVSSMESRPAAGASPPSGRHEHGDVLGRLLPSLERDLRTAETRIDDLRRNLDAGALPPKERLIQLRSTLERIAPVLLALDRQLAAVGRLSPRLQELLRRVRARLASTRASAASLVAALRRSGADGPAVRLLLRELEDFGPLPTVPPANLGVGLAGVPPLPGGSVAYPQAQNAVAALQRPTASVPERSATSHQASRAPNRGGTDTPAPMPSAAGSATASAGGAFSGAGLALLATMLIALALPRLRAWLALPAGRRYAVAFLAQLERPG